MKRALIVWGGWDGHEPRQVAEWFTQILTAEAYEVEIADSLAAFDDTEKLQTLDLIVPQWTMGELTKERAEAVSAAVGAGTGLAGLHGGMCDSFRTNVLWQFMTGGNWVAHPGGDGVEYTVNIKNSSSPLVAGINDFVVHSEQYYLHVDPAVEVLATTRFPTVTWYHSANRPVDMPVLWTKRWGLGRVFYCSLGHHADIVQMPEVTEIMTRGFRWAGDGKRDAQQQGLNADVYQNSGKMF
jgi:hypothetical protein